MTLCVAYKPPPSALAPCLSDASWNCILVHARFSRCSECRHVWSSGFKNKNLKSAATREVPAETDSLHAVSGHLWAWMQWNELSISNKLLLPLVGCNTIKTWLGFNIANSEVRTPLPLKERSKKPRKTFSNSEPYLQERLLHCRNSRSGWRQYYRWMQLLSV